MKTNAQEIWSKRVARWKESGLTAKEFAADMGIKAKTLQQWSYRLKKLERDKQTEKQSAEPSIHFVELTEQTVQEADNKRTDPVPARIELEPLEVVLKDGIRVRVPAHFDTDVLRRVVVAIEGR